MKSLGKKCTEEAINTPDYSQRIMELGEGSIQHRLGDMYFHGIGGATQDKRKGAEYLQKAADKGIAGAQLELGMLCLTGDEGVPQDETKGMELLRRAADQGNADARAELGRLDSHREVALESTSEERPRFQATTDQEDSFGQLILESRHTDTQEKDKCSIQ